MFNKSLIFIARNSYNNNNIIMQQDDDNLKKTVFVLENTIRNETKLIWNDSFGNYLPIIKIK